jgi:type I restriction enzyme S subunit
MKAGFATLGEVAEFINGAAFKPSDWGDVGKKIIRIQNLTDSSKPYNKTTRSVNKKLNVNYGDILVSWSATLGVFVWTEKDEAVLNQHIFKVIHNSKIIDKNYLRHCLHQALDAMTKHLHGATMKHVNRGEFLATQIPLPPLAEQQRIAAMLDTADHILKQRESAIAKLDQLASTTFDEMYDALDAVSTKSLGEILELQRGASPRPISDWMTEEEDGVNWIKIADATASDKYIYKCKERIKKEAVAMTRYVKSGDFLLSNSMSFGRPYILKTDGCIHDGWLLLRDTKNIFEQDFLYAALSCKAIKEQFKKLATGAVVKNLNIDAVSKVKIKIPEKKIQIIFSKKMHELEANKATHLKQLTIVNSLLSSLHHQSFGVN